jgi:hypothetical protein
MIRRYNYTGRRRIERADVRIAITEQTGEIHASLNLEPYDLPADAKVFVEAYRHTNWVRFGFGTVAAVAPPEASILDTFGTTEGVLCRVKVSSSSGTLLAEADQIAPVSDDTSEQERDPLLPIQPEDLDDEVFALAFGDGERPILKMNRRLGDWRAVARHPLFVSLVLPQVFRDILIRILCIDRYDDVDDDGDWRALWLRFAAALPGCVEPPSASGEIDTIDDWIGEAVAAFSRIHGFAYRFRASWGEGSEP